MMACLVLPAVAPRLCRASVFQSWRESAMGNLRGCGVRIVLFCAALILTAVAATPVSAQTFRGTILGTVTDTSGAAVLNAKVSALNVATGVERTTETNGDGSYLIPELPIGTYKVTIILSGFQSVVTNGVVVDVAAEKRVDAVLKPGQVSQQVTVEGEDLPQIDTTGNTLGSTMTQENVKDLPINGRDYTKLIFLSPGVAGSPDQITDSPGSFGEFSMNGARGRSNNYLLDGTDMNDGYRNDPAINQAGVFGTPSAILPIDAVSELRVLSNFEPEYGRNGGAVVNIVTVSGTNQFHGDAFEYFRNDALGARNYFNFVGEPEAKFRNNQFGGSLGGPIIKDKTFFFVDYEGQRENVGVVTLACVPTGSAPDGSLAPSDATNPVIANLLALHPWPAPNLGGSCPNASVTSPSFNNLSSFIAKIDHNFDPNNVLTGRYYFGDSTQSFPLALTASGGQLPGFNTTTPTRVQLVSLSYVHVFSSTKTNELRYGWNRFAEGFFPQDQAFNPSSIGLCAASDTVACSGSGPADSGLPIILVGSFAQLGATSSVPRHRVDSNNQLIDGFSWILGKHSMKFGFEFRRTSVTQFFDKYFRGKLSFLTLPDFLDGDLNTAFGKSFQYSGDTLRHTHQNGFGIYAQDSFRITPRITLNYGLRWDYFGVMSEKDHLFSNFDTNLGELVQVGPGGFSNLYRPTYNNFAPRLSIAWDVFGTGRTVVRSGYGIFYDAFSQDMALGHLPYPPFFDPGPAYNSIGPDPILPAAAIGGPGGITAGVPIYGAPSCSSVECDIFAFDRNIKTPYMENYNLNVEQQISSKIALQVGYVGSQGHRLFRFFDISQPSQAEITAADCPFGIATCAATGAIQDFAVPRRFGFPNGSFYIMQENSKGKSNYNSLQVSLRVNNWHGLSSVVNYVWSRSLDNSSDGEDFVPNAAQPNDSTNPQAEYGPSNFNIPNRFTWVLAYQLPTMGGDHQRLKNGWGFDSTVTLQSGQPFQLNYNFEPGDDYSGSGEGDDRPDIVGPILYHKHDPNNYIDLTSFAIPCTPTGAALLAPTGTDGDCTPGTRHFGDLGRNALVGPTFKQWDFAIHKDTKITERLGVQLRAEFFNILNHPNFANPLLPAFIADPASNGFGINGGRETGVGGYHITATGDVGIGNPFLGGGGPRGIQLAAKFTF
jgi:hypothetical protein